MESKSSAASSSSGGGDSQQWWRWSSGKSGGAIASSSDTSVASTAHLSDHAFASNSSAGSSPSAESSLRWQKRASSSSRAALTPPKDAGSDLYFTGGAWSPSGGSSSGSPSSSGNSSSSSGSSPKFFSSTSSMISARGLPSVSARKVSSHSAPLARPIGSSSSSREASQLGKKKAPAMMAPSPFSASVSSSSHFAPSSSSSSSLSSSLSRSMNGAALAVGGAAEISWSAAPTKRRVKKASKTPVPLRRASLYAPRPIRPIAEERVVTSSSTSRSAAASQPVLRVGSTENRVESTPSLLFTPGASGSARGVSSPSPLASFAPLTSYSTKKDPLVNCARAVLQDCIMKRRLERSSSMRKRNIDDCVRSDMFNSKTGAYVPKTSECGILSSCSSSSDEELSQLSSMERSFNSVDKFDDDDYKLSKEEMDRRELMLGATALSSSPDFDCFSPFLDEEKGLPVEIRYQLPLALGTANEIDKECTICQIRYGIGDHIVTLPCQHFFHACCVDKWLWNHTSCPLCRTDVTLDLEPDAALNPKHNFTECSQFDQETIRRKMRTSSQSAGFRPVVPVNVELTEIEAQLASLSVHETNQPKYLVCPKPQRPHSK